MYRLAIREEKLIYRGNNLYNRKRNRFLVYDIVRYVRPGENIIFYLNRSGIIYRKSFFFLLLLFFLNVFPNEEFIGFEILRAPASPRPSPSSTTDANRQRPRERTTFFSAYIHTRVSRIWQKRDESLAIENRSSTYI